MALLLLRPDHRLYVDFLEGSRRGVSGVQQICEEMMGIVPGGESNMGGYSNTTEINSNTDIFLAVFMPFFLLLHNN